MKWLRVSMRELLLLMVIVALALGWWIDRNSLSIDNASLAKEIQTCTRHYNELIALFRKWDGRDIYVNWIESNKFTAGESPSGLWKSS